MVEDLRPGGETDGCGHARLKIVNFEDSWNEVDELFLPSVNHVFFFPSLSLSLSLSLSAFFFFTENALLRDVIHSRIRDKRFKTFLSD